MSIKAAFLFSLLLTSGFERLDAKRLDRDKLKQIKHELGDEGVATHGLGDEDAAKQAAVTVEEKSIIEDFDKEAAEHAAMMVVEKVEEKSTIEDRDEDAAGSALAQVKPADLNEATVLPVTLSGNPQVHACGSAPHSGGMPVVNLDRSAVQAVKNVDQRPGLDGVLKDLRGGATSEQHDWAAGINTASKVLGGTAAAGIVATLVSPTAIELALAAQLPNYPVVLAGAAAGGAALTWATLPQKKGNTTEEEKEQRQYQSKIAKLEEKLQVAKGKGDLAKVEGDLDKVKKLAKVKGDLELEIKSLRSQAKQNRERWAKINAAKQIEERERQRQQAQAAKSAAMKEEGRAPKGKKA